MTMMMMFVVSKSRNDNQNGAKKWRSSYQDIAILITMDKKKRREAPPSSNSSNASWRKIEFMMPNHKIETNDLTPARPLMCEISLGRSSRKGTTTSRTR